MTRNAFATCQVDLTSNMALCLIPFSVAFVMQTVVTMQPAMRAVLATPEFHEFDYSTDGYSSEEDFVSYEEDMAEFEEIEDAALRAVLTGEDCSDLL